MFPEKSGGEPECLLRPTLPLHGEMRETGRIISASQRFWVVVDVARAGSRTQHPEEKGGRKENLTHILQKNVTESKEAEEGFTLMDFQPRGINQNGSTNPDETRSAVRGEGSRHCVQLHQLPWEPEQWEAPEHLWGGEWFVFADPQHPAALGLFSHWSTSP